MRKIETLCELYDYATVTYAGNRLSKTVDAELEYSYQSFRNKCEELSGMLADAGIVAGDKVAVLAQNMPNWTVAFFTGVAFGRIAVPILPESSENEVTNILKHSESPGSLRFKEAAFKCKR